MKIKTKKGMRGVFTPPTGMNIAVSDFSSQELRVAAVASGDKEMLETYFLEQSQPKKIRLDTGEEYNNPITDLHLVAALGIFPELLNYPEWQWLKMAKTLERNGKNYRHIGKAQPLDAKVLTPAGWVYMGDLKVGDTVSTPNGGTANILKLFPQGVQSVYRVTMSDGSCTESTLDHLWYTQTKYERQYKLKGKVRELRELQANLKLKNTNRGVENNFSIPLVSNLSFIPKENLLIHPYLLGVLLGDGGISQYQTEIHNTDTELINKCRTLLPPNHTLIFKSGCTWVIGSYQKHSVLRKELEVLGLRFKRSHEKFIPELYKFSSETDRLELLKGLIDTDGYSSGANGISYTTCSYQLAKDVTHLVQSLGGTVKLRQKTPIYKHKGQIRQGRLSYTLQINLPTGVNPFYLSRKLDKYTGVKTPKRLIDKIEYVEDKDCQCILIDSEEHLYITDNFIVTHNTLNFGTIYGAQATRVQQEVGGTIEEAELIIEGYFAKFSGLKRWLDRMATLARFQKWVEGIDGRKYFCAEDNAKGGNDENTWIRKACNAAIQGPSATMSKRAGWYIFNAYEKLNDYYSTRIVGFKRAELVALIHDEAVSFVPGERRLVDIKADDKGYSKLIYECDDISWEFARLKQECMERSMNEMLCPYIPGGVAIGKSETAVGEAWSIK